MKVFVVINENNAHDEGNPYVPTLEDSIRERYDDIEFVSQKNLFWEQDDWDVVHFMWPDGLSEYLKNGFDLEGRINYLKNRGTIFIATIHNLKSHFDDEYRLRAYDIVYPLMDIMIHLWSQSKVYMHKSFPKMEHVLIPHHIYDTKYSNILPSKKEALKYFNLKNGTYVLSFGGIRKQSERKLIISAAKNCRDVNFVVPRFIDIPQGKINIRWIKQRLKKVYYKLRYPNLIISGNSFISDEELPMYYALCDISFIQRVQILNSGNVIMGMYMGHVIVGPRDGNVGILLQDTCNYTFDPLDENSVASAIYDATKAINQNLGAKNKEYSMRFWNTKKISDELYDLYKLSNINNIKKESKQ